MDGEDKFFSFPRGLRLHYVAWGNPDSPPLVLLHGWMDIARSWDRVAPVLAKHFRVLALDFRGHGLSDMVPGGLYYYFPDYLRDVDGLVKDAIGERAFFLVGHSMGGMVASQYAGAFPKRILRFVNIEGFGPPAAPPDAAPQRYANWVEAAGRQTQKEPRPYGTLEEVAAKLRKANPRLSEDFALHLALHATKKGADGKYRFGFDPLHKAMGPIPFNLEQAKAFWRRISCPALVIVGEKSDFQTHIPDWRERVGVISNSQVVEIPGAGHMIHHEKPEALAKTLLGFCLE